MKNLDKDNLLEYIDSLENRIDKLEEINERFRVALINCEQRETESMLENL